MASETLTVQIEDILDDYVEEVQDATDKAIKEVARQSVKTLKATSPTKTGDYAKGWATKKVDGGLVVYNKTDWQLTHLLENGHVVKPSPKHPNKMSRVAPRKHIKPVEEWASNELPVRISKRLS